ncbi:hypothetical protein MNBD_GAMMA03-1754 [hydrothermal vent metagenome]|uniref:Uncharacterized protein n=1 Tax=hydrothermal vent metagenome TaxID=652676 RepID=A0A3B0W1I2_9ZZZZ
MGIFSKISLMIWLILLLAAAIMFDWFDSRELVSKFLESSQVAVEKLKTTGDHVQGIIEEVKEDSDVLKNSDKTSGE